MNESSALFIFINDYIDEIRDEDNIDGFDSDEDIFEMNNENDDIPLQIETYEPDNEVLTSYQRQTQIMMLLIL